MHVSSDAISSRVGWAVLEVSMALMPFLITFAAVTTTLIFLHQHQVSLFLAD